MLSPTRSVATAVCLLFPISTFLLSTSIFRRENQNLMNNNATFAILNMTSTLLKWLSLLLVKKKKKRPSP